MPSSDKDAGSSGDSSNWKKYAVITVGGLLILAGLGALFQGGLGVLSGILWIITGLVIIPKTRASLFGVIEGAGGPNLSTAGTVAIAIIVVVGFAGGAVLAPNSGDSPNQEAGASSGSTDTPTPSSTQASGGEETTTTATEKEEAVDSPTETDSTTTQEEERELSNEEILLAFRITLEDLDYNIDNLEINKETNTIILDYRSTATTQEELAGEIGGVAGAFAEGVNQGWDVYYIDVTVSDTNGDDVANYYIETGWAEQYNNGEMSQEEYFTKILDTLVVFD